MVAYSRAEPEPSFGATSTSICGELEAGGCSMSWLFLGLAGRAARGPDRCWLEGQKVAAFGEETRWISQHGFLALT